MEKCKQKNVGLALGLIETKSGKACCCLVAELGYRDITLSFDEALTAEALGISVYELYSIKQAKQDEINAR